MNIFGNRSIMALLLCGGFLLHFGLQKALYICSTFHVWTVTQPRCSFDAIVIPYETPWPNDLYGKWRHRAWKWVSLVLQFPDKPSWLAHSFCWWIRCFSSIVLKFTAAGSYIALNDVQTTSSEYGHDTPHHDFSDSRNKCTLITYLPFRNLLQSISEISLPNFVV